MYGTMMGTTSVTIDDINDTAQNMIGNFTPINTGDPMAYMGAMSALVAIEHFAMTHNVLLDASANKSPKCQGRNEQSQPAC